MMPFEHISQAPAVMNGQLCIKGTRLTVGRILAAVAAYPNRAELLLNYPELSEEILKEALAYRLPRWTTA
ncbi:MAG TPA: DUF433 domain-containing protein [Phycisphaerae bacterium]